MDKPNPTPVLFIGGPYHGQTHWVSFPDEEQIVDKEYYYSPVKITDISDNPTHRGYMYKGVSIEGIPK